MEMMVVIPIASYHAMLAKCDSTRVEFALLKNGIIARNGEGHQKIEILW